MGFAALYPSYELRAAGYWRRGAVAVHEVHDN
jgi:hypothetical protein